MPSHLFVAFHRKTGSPIINGQYNNKLLLTKQPIIRNNIGHYLVSLNVSNYLEHDVVDNNGFKYLMMDHTKNYPFVKTTWNWHPELINDQIANIIDTSIIDPLLAKEMFEVVDNDFNNDKRKTPENYYDKLEISKKIVHRYAMQKYDNYVNRYYDNIGICSTEQKKIYTDEKTYVDEKHNYDYDIKWHGISATFKKIDDLYSTLSVHKKITAELFCKYPEYFYEHKYVQNEKN